MRRPIAVLLAADSPAVREATRSLVESAGDIQVVGAASSGAEALEMVKQLQPAVLVMDLAASPSNGLEATREILRVDPKIRVLILYTHRDDTYVHQLMALGAAGYLLQPTAGRFLPRAIREVEKGHFFLCRLVSGRESRIGKPPEFRSSARRNRVRLNSLEVELRRLIADGRGNKLIAAELAISAKAVKKHRRRLLQKLELPDCAGLSGHPVAAVSLESAVRLTLL